MSEDSSEKSFKGVTEYITGKKEKLEVDDEKKGVKSSGEEKEVSSERFKRLIALLLGERVFDKSEREGLLAEAKKVREQLEKEKPDPRILDEYRRLLKDRRRVLWQIYSGEEISNFSEDQMAGKASKSQEVREIIKVWNESLKEGKKKGLSDKEYGEKIGRLGQRGVKVEEGLEEEWGELIDEVNAGYVVYAGKYEIKGGMPDNLVEDLLSRKYKKLEEERIPGEELRKLLLSDEYRQEREGDFKWGNSMDEFKSEVFLTYLATIPIDKDQFPKLQQQWIDFLRNAYQDVSGKPKVDRYRHFSSLRKDMEELVANGHFTRVFRQMEESGKEGEKQVQMARVFMASMGEAIDNELRSSRKELDWLMGAYEGREDEFKNMLDVFFNKDKEGKIIKEVLDKLKGKGRGEDLNEAEMGALKRLSGALKGMRGAPETNEGDFEGEKFGNLTNEKQDELMDRFFEQIGGLTPIINDMQNKRKVPEEWKSAEDYQDEQQPRMMPGGRGRVHPDVPVPAEGFGEEASGERSPFAIPDNLIRKHLQVHKNLGETSAEAIERGLNTFLETGADERSMHYLSSHMNNMLAGEEGNIDQPLHLLYHAAKGHSGLYGFVPGITQPEDLLKMGSAMAAGTDDDLVERKDFKHYGGVQGFKIWDEERNQYTGELTTPQQEFFSVGPFDVMDALTDNYWYSAFQDKGRGYDQHPKRHKMMAEVMFMNMGGEVRMVRMKDGKLDRRYFIKGLSEDKNKYGLSMDEMTQMELRFGKQMKIARMKDPRTLDFDYVYTDKVKLQDLAKSHLWMTMLGEAQWELSGRRALMDRYIDGRRNIYQWDKFMNYDVYGGKLGGHRGFPAFVTEDEKPILDLNRSDYISKYIDKMGAFLFRDGDFVRVDSKTGKPVKDSGVDGVRKSLTNNETDADKELARQFVAMMKARFIDPHKALKDQDLFRTAFMTDTEMALSLGMKGNVEKHEGVNSFLKRLKKSKNEEDKKALHLWQRWKTAQFTGKDRELIKKMHWEKLLTYLAGGSLKERPSLEGGDFRHWPPRITVEERNYVYKELMGAELKDGVWTFGEKGPSAEARERAAKWFFEHYSDRYYFWGRLEHNQHLKEANYTRQAAAQAPKMLRFNEQPTADNLLEWTLPMFGFNNGSDVRQINYDAAQWNLRLLRRRPLAEMGAAFYSDKHPGLFNAWCKIFGKPTLAEAKNRGVGSIDYAGQIDKYGYPKMKPRNFWKRPGESLMIMLKGAGQLKGHKALDAWARKHYIEKLWHAGGIEWVQKEALMAEFLTPALYGGSAITGRFLARLIDIERGKLLNRDFFKKDKLLNQTVRTMVILGIRYPALAAARLMQWSFLHTWIHDFGEFGKVYWNEVIAPAAFGENAKAAQLQV